MTAANVASSTPVIAVRRLTKTYGRGENAVHALRGVDLDISRGEMVAIMGSSGSGKSTFMNLIGCLDRPTDGSYLLEGEDVAGLERDQLAEVRNRRIGFVFQSFNLLSRTSALENVELPLLYASSPRPTNGSSARTVTSAAHESVEVRATRALTLVGLADRIRHHPNQLSGGQQQRVAIARALVNDPSILLADEPTGNLDTRTSIEIMRLFQDLNDKGMTVLLITHEHDIAEYAKRVIVLQDGRILEDRPVEKRRVATDELRALPTVTEVG